MCYTWNLYSNPTICSALIGPVTATLEYTLTGITTTKKYTCPCPVTKPKHLNNSNTKCQTSPNILASYQTNQIWYQEAIRYARINSTSPWQEGQKVHPTCLWKTPLSWTSRQFSPTMPHQCNCSTVSSTDTRYDETNITSPWLPCHARGSSSHLPC